MIKICDDAIVEPLCVIFEQRLVSNFLLGGKQMLFQFIKRVIGNKKQTLNLFVFKIFKNCCLMQSTII